MPTSFVFYCLAGLFTILAVCSTGYARWLQVQEGAVSSNARKAEISELKENTEILIEGKTKPDLVLKKSIDGRIKKLDQLRLETKGNDTKSIAERMADAAAKVQGEKQKSELQLESNKLETKQAVLMMNKYVQPILQMTLNEFDAQMESAVSQGLAKYISKVSIEELGISMSSISKSNMKDSKIYSLREIQWKYGAHVSYVRFRPHMFRSAGGMALNGGKIDDQFEYNKDGVSRSDQLLRKIKYTEFDEIRNQQFIIKRIKEATSEKIERALYDMEIAKQNGVQANW